jgi:lipid-A-disaccharide synthase
VIVTARKSGEEQTAELVIALIAGESSGDQLGSRLMASLKMQSARPIRFVGVGGPLMEAEGLNSIFPMSDIAVNGIFPVLAKLPTLLNRIATVSLEIASQKPNIVVHIDAQDFNQRVARKLKDLIPQTPLIGYVSPTVWAWRPGRAKKIKKLYDKLLAVLPFEPDVHRKLGGPETIYVGHPLLERAKDWTRSPSEEKALSEKPYKLLILPGSRESEARKLLPLFRNTVQALFNASADVHVIIPVVDHLAQLIEEQVADWPIKPLLVRGEAEKWAAFRLARAALAASGTVTLEIALAKVPMVVAYRVSYFEEMLGHILITSKFASLPNIILDREAVSEYLDHTWKGEALAPLLMNLMQDGFERKQQLDAFNELQLKMQPPLLSNPSETAAQVILNEIVQLR